MSGIPNWVEILLREEYFKNCATSTKQSPHVHTFSPLVLSSSHLNHNYEQRLEHRLEQRLKHRSHRHKTSRVNVAKAAACRAHHISKISPHVNRTSSTMGYEHIGNKWVPSWERRVTKTKRQSHFRVQISSTRSMMCDVKWPCHIYNETGAAFLKSARSQFHETGLWKAGEIGERLPKWRLATCGEGGILHENSLKLISNTEKPAVKLYYQQRARSFEHWFHQFSWILT